MVIELPIVRSLRTSQNWPWMSPTRMMGELSMRRLLSPRRTSSTCLQTCLTTRSSRTSSLLIRSSSSLGFIDYRQKYSNKQDHQGYKKVSISFDSIKDYYFLQREANHSNDFNIDMNDTTQLKLLFCMEDNIAYYTLNQTFSSLPIKQKTYNFSSPLASLIKNINKQDDTQNSSAYPQYDCDNPEFRAMNSPWRPRLPSKKLFDQPRFFLSLERKKIRLIKGLNNMTQMNPNKSVQGILQGAKVKESRHSSLNKIRHNLSKKNSAYQAEPNRLGPDGNYKTPFLNFNMQYLIKKRRAMSPRDKKQHKSQLFPIHFK